MQLSTAGRPQRPVSTKPSIPFAGPDKQIISYPIEPTAEEAIRRLYDQGVDEVNDFIHDVRYTPYFKVFTLLLFEYILTGNEELYVALDNITAIHSKCEDYADGVIVHNTFTEMAMECTYLIDPLPSMYLATKHFVYLEIYNDNIMVTLTHEALPTKHGLSPVTNPLSKRLQYRPKFKEAESYEPLYPTAAPIEW